MTRRVVVTGVGLVSSVGLGTEATWQALCAGQSGIAPITHFDASAFASRIAGEVKGFDPLQFLEKKDVKKMDTFIQFALAAATFAMNDAQLTVTPEIADEVGVFIASGIGGFRTIEREHEELLKGGPRRISPFFIPASIINLAAGHVSIRFGAKGPNLATCTACTASAHSIGESFEIIRRGDATTVLVAMWPCGPVALWPYAPVAPMALWPLWPCSSGPCGPPFGIVILWPCGPVVLWLCSPLALWPCGSVALWPCSPVALWPCSCVALWPLIL